MDMSNQDIEADSFRPVYTTTQETQVNETTQELPAVAKLREAFDTARNALIDGSELARVVTDLRGQVGNLIGEVATLQRDLEYVRNRNRELDEQVTAVRAARDNALAEAGSHKDRADNAETLYAEEKRATESLRSQLSIMYDRIDALKKERDDAQMAQMEMDDKLKSAQAKLAKIGEAFGITKEEIPSFLPEKAKPHYETQPRDEVGKFQPTTYDRGSQSEGEGF